MSTYKVSVIWSDREPSLDYDCVKSHFFVNNKNLLILTLAQDGTAVVNMDKVDAVYFDGDVEVWK